MGQWQVAGLSACGVLLGLKGVWSGVPEQVSWPERDAYNRGGGRGLNLWAEARGRV